MTVSLVCSSLKGCHSNTGPSHLQGCDSKLLCRHTLLDEARILLLHGLLHLLDYDHEADADGAAAMAAAEQSIMQQLQWKVRLCFACCLQVCGTLGTLKSMEIRHQCAAASCSRASTDHSLLTQPDPLNR